MLETTAGRLLRAESRSLVPLLQAIEPRAFDLPTELPGWSVRDVIAHCAAAMGNLAVGRPQGFTPEENQVDVESRRHLPLPDLLAELAGAYEAAALVVDRTRGTFDGIALGEWVHGGDIRAAIGRRDAYVSRGVGDALALLLARSKAREVPTTAVVLVDAQVHPELGDAWSDFHLGRGDGPAIGSLKCDVASLFRLTAGRPHRAVQLAGVSEADLRVFF